MIQTPAAPPERMARPRTATTGFALYIGAALGVLLSAAAGSIVIGTQSGALLSAPVRGTSLHGADLVPIAVGLVVALGVAQTALLVGFAVALRAGRGWARWVLAVLVLLSLPDVTDAYGLGVQPVIFGIVAAVCSFLPSITGSLRVERARRRTVVS